MRRYSVLIVLGTCSLAAGAQQQDAILLSASQSVAHDTNLLRLPSGADPAAQTGVASRSDTILRTAAGLAFDREFSRQRVRASALVNADRFAHHRQFDFNGYQTAGIWDWALGTQWFGNASFRADRVLASFVDVRTAEKNLIDRNLARFGAGYRLTPRWAAVAAAEVLQVRNSAASLAVTDFRDASVEAGARFAPGTGADWSLLWRHGQGRFTGDAPLGSANSSAAFTDRGYSDDRLLMRLSIEPNEISRISGDIGYTRRQYDDASRGEFSGVTYALEYLWRRGDIFSVGAYLRRDVGAGAGVGAGTSTLSNIAAAQVLTANYADTRHFGLRPTWQLTGKMRLHGQLEYIDRRFGVDAVPAPLGGAARHDKLHAVGASVDYELLRKVVVTAFVRQERRSSSQAQFDFDARVAGAALEVRF